MRAHFLLDPDIVFLNHGSFGACPREVFADFQHWQLELERNPVAFLGRRSGALLSAARATLAAHVGAQAADLVFIPNATHGVNIVARSLVLQPGDEVLATDHEYGACDATWRFVCQRAGAHYKQVRLPVPYEADSVVATLMAAVTPRTRVLFASHITSTTALIFPVAALCAAARAHGITTVIDGAHAPGHVQLDLQTLDADFYTGNCHKWLCAPKGSAFLHARPERQAELDAAVVSWGYLAAQAAEDQASGGHTGFDAYTGRTLFERRMQWQGTRDIAAFLAVPAAIDFQQRNSWAAHRERCHLMACETRQRVVQRNGLPLPAPDAAHGQMVTIPVRLNAATNSNAAENLRRWLFDARHIEVPVTQHGDSTFVRVAVQAYNTPADMDALVSALADAGV